MSFAILRGIIDLVFELGGIVIKDPNSRSNFQNRSGVSA